MVVMIPFLQQERDCVLRLVLLHTLGMRKSVIPGHCGLHLNMSLLTVDCFGRHTLFLASGMQILASQVLIYAIIAAKLWDSGGVG